MTGTTLSGAYVSITLTNTADNPVSVTGRIDNPNGSGLTAAAGDWTIANSGTIQGRARFPNATGRFGIALGQGGTISNAAGAVVLGFNAGIYVAGIGTVTNAGTITGTGAFSSFSFVGQLGVRLLGGEVDNAGRIDGAVLLDGDGMVANSGSISNGVVLHAGTVVNSGLISTPDINAGNGNPGITMTGGRIDNQYTGVIRHGLLLTGAVATLANEGLIYGYSHIGRDSVITNAELGYIERLSFSSGTLHNAGLIGQASGGGTSGGSLANAATGTIQGGFTAGSGDWMVSNAGTIGSPGNSFAAGLRLNGTNVSVANLAGGMIYAGVIAAIGGTASFTLDNQGTILPTGRFVDERELGVRFASGRVTNGAGGTIMGGVYASGDKVGQNRIGRVQVVNAGAIVGGGAGVSLDAGGTVTNQAGGTISGRLGIGTADPLPGKGISPTTIVNAGTVVGLDGVAVSLPGDLANRVVLAPGGSFVGVVNAGRATVGPGANTLELAADAQRGTLTGFGSHYVNFGRVELDAGASWALGDPTLPASATVANAGTLTVPAALYSRATISGGLSLAAGATLVNGPHGVIAAAGTAVAGTGGAVTNTSGATILGRVGIRLAGQPGAIVNAGTIAGTGIAIVLATGGSVQNRASGTITGAEGIRVTAGAATIVNAGSIAAPSSSARAIRFADADGNRLVIGPGSAIAGQVQGGAGSDTLELGAGAGTIAWIGAHYTGFETLAVQPAAQWRMTGLNTLAGVATLAISAGSTLSVAGTLRATGDLSLARLGNLTALGTGAVVVGGAPSSAGAITVSAGQGVSGIGTLQAATIIDSGTITAAGGTLRLVGSLSGGGTIAIDNRSVMAVYGTLGLPRITFLPGDGQTLLLGNPFAVAATIDGFGTTDTIDLVGIGLATSASFNAGTLSLSTPAGAVSLHFAGSYDPARFTLAASAHGGTNLSYV